MQPTVGRIVYYKSRGSADGVFPPQDFASIVTAVNRDGTVGLATFSENGIRFEHSATNGQEAGQWDWMPFQKANGAQSQGAYSGGSGGSGGALNPGSPS